MKIGKLIKVIKLENLIFKNSQKDKEAISTAK
jgi:hypothetical protein